MALASFSRIKKRAIAALLANGNAYADTVSGDVGRFLESQEFTDAALQKDAEICITALETPNHWLRNHFTPTLSSVLANGAQIPAHQGAIGAVMYSTDGVTYSKSKLATSKDEILEVLETSGVYGSSASDYAGWHWIEDGVLYHTSPYAKVYYYSFTIGLSPQATEFFEDAIAQGVISTLDKDGSITPDVHARAESKFQQALANIKSYPRVIPEQQNFEMQTA